jgi:ATP dependent DNA ligase C terminal region
MSGFSDAFYKASKERLDARGLLPKAPPYYNTGERPDVWFEAAEVWEIRGADLTISPVHRAATGRLVEGRGCSLRFPRFIQARLLVIVFEAVELRADRRICAALCCAPSCQRCVCAIGALGVASCRSTFCATLCSARSRASAWSATHTMLCRSVKTRRQRMRLGLTILSRCTLLRHASLMPDG